MIRSLWAILIWFVSLPAAAADFGWDIGAHQRFPPHVGFVALHVLSNFEVQEPGFAGWNGLGVRRIDGQPHDYQLQGANQAISSGQIFAAALPAGEYQLVRLWALRTDIGVSRMFNYPIPEAHARFTVTAGRFTDLGTLAAYVTLDGPVEADLFSKNYRTLSVRLPSRPSLLPWFRSVYPSAKGVPLADTGTKDASGSAEAGSTPGAPIEIRSLTGTGIPRRLADGIIVVPGRMGQIRLRSADGTWVTVDSGYTADINDVLAVDQGLLVVGDRGLVALGGNDARTWTAYPGIPADQAFYWIERSASGAIYALSSNDEYAALWRLSVDESAAVELARFGRKQGFQPARRKGVSLIGPLPPLLTMFAPAQATRPSVLRLDADGLQLAVGRKRWLYRSADAQLLAQPSATYVAAVYAQPNGTLVASAGKDVELLYSVDRGANWSAFRRPSATGNRATFARNAAAYLNDEHEILVIAPRLSRSGKLEIVASPQMYLQMATDPRKTFGWRAIQEMPRDCRLLLPTISSDDALYVQCHDQRVLRSGDGGRSWQLDRPAGADPARQRAASPKADSPT